MKGSNATDTIRWKALLDIVATIAMTCASFVLIWGIVVAARRPPNNTSTTPARKALPSVQIPLTGSLRGNPNAEVGVIIFSDFQCPFCASFSLKTLPAVIKTYVDTGRILLAFKHVPSERIHPFSLRAAESAECAGDQRKFWEMHDFLFLQGKRLTEDAVRRGAAAIGLNSQAFEACLEGTKTEQIRAEALQARQFGVTGTPTLMYGRVQGGKALKVIGRSVGAGTLEGFASQVSELLR